MAKLAPSLGMHVRHYYEQYCCLQLLFPLVFLLYGLLSDGTVGHPPSLPVSGDTSHIFKDTCSIDCLSSNTDR